MASRPGAQTRAPEHGPDDRRLRLNAAARRAGYNPDYLRKMIGRASDPPPFFMRDGVWWIWESDLDRWLDGRAS